MAEVADGPPAVAGRTPPPRASVVRNVAWYWLGNVLAKPAWFLFLTAGCMRVLGVEGYGAMTVALALAGTTFLLSDLGSAEYMVREVSRAPHNVALYFSNLAVGRLALSVVAAVVTLGVGWALAYSPAQMAALAAAALFVAAFRAVEFCRGVFRTFEVLRYEALSVVVEKALVIALGAAGLLLTRDAWGVLGGMAVGAVLTLGVNVHLIHTRFARLDGALIDPAFLVRCYRGAIPIGTFSVATLALLSFAPVAVEAVLGQAAAGTYGAAYRVLEATMLLPSAFGAAVLPRLARLHHDGGSRPFEALLWRSAGSLLLLALVATAALWVVAPALVPLLGGSEFREAGGLLRLMTLALAPMSMTALLAVALISSDDHWFAAGVVASAAVVNVVACVATLAPLGLAGPAWSLVVCHAAIAVVCALRLALNARRPRPLADPCSTPS